MEQNHGRHHPDQRIVQSRHASTEEVHGGLRTEKDES